MCQINHQFSPMKPRCRLRYVGNVFFSFQCTINDENRWLNKEKFLKGDKTSMLHYCDAQCTVVLYRDWLLQMGQMGPKMTLGTMKMSGDDFPGV